MFNENKLMGQNAELNHYSFSYIIKKKLRDKMLEIGDALGTHEKITT